jgi:cysteine synthase
MGTGRYLKEQNLIQAVAAEPEDASTASKA